MKVIKNIKLIIFDWDDVFTLGSREGYFKCYDETLRDIGVHLGKEEQETRIRAKWGKAHHDVLGELLREHPELLSQACEVHEKKLFGETFANCLRLVEGSKDTLKKLSEKYLLTIATGLHPDLLRNVIMPKFEVPDVFSTIISSYDVSNPELQKPHPHIANTILEKHGVSPEEAILVGDARGDVAMARAAGVTPVVVLTGYLSQEEAENLEVEYILRDVGKIGTLFDN